MLELLWDTLSDCLSELAETPDHHAVLVLQPAVEAFFLVHASPEKDKKYVLVLHLYNYVILSHSINLISIQ